MAPRSSSDGWMAFLLGLDEGQGLLDDNVDGPRPQFRRIRAGVVEKLGDDAVEPVDLLGDHIQEVLLLLAFRLGPEDLGGPLD